MTSFHVHHVYITSILSSSTGSQRSLDTAPAVCRSWHALEHGGRQRFPHLRLAEFPLGFPFAPQRMSHPGCPRSRGSCSWVTRGWRRFGSWVMLIQILRPVQPWIVDFVMSGGPQHRTIVFGSLSSCQPPLTYTVPMYHTDSTRCVGHDLIVGRAKLGAILLAVPSLPNLRHLPKKTPSPCCGFCQTRQPPCAHYSLLWLDRCFPCLLLILPPRALRRVMPPDMSVHRAGSTCSRQQSLGYPNPAVTAARSKSTDRPAHHAILLDTNAAGTGVVYEDTTLTSVVGLF